MTKNPDGVKRHCGAPVHLRSVRTRVLDHVDRSTLPSFAKAMSAIAEALRSGHQVAQAASSTSTRRAAVRRPAQSP